MLPNVISASTLTGDDVENSEGESLGKIKEIMLDPNSGRIAYAVLGMRENLGFTKKLFAVPWGALTLRQEEKTFILNVPKDRLKDAPGFDKDDWPDFANQEWGAGVHTHYGVTPYWS